MLLQFIAELGSSQKSVGRFIKRRIASVTCNDRSIWRADVTSIDAL